MRKLLSLILFFPLFAAAQAPTATKAVNADSVKNVNIIKYYTKQLAQKPKDASAFYKRGDAKLNLGYYKEAILDLNHCLLLDPKNDDALVDRGLAKDDIKDYKGGIADYTHAIAINPKDSYAYYDRAIAKRHLEDYKGAIDDYNQAITLNTTDEDFFDNRGIAKSDILNTPIITGGWRNMT